MGIFDDILKGVGVSEEILTGRAGGKAIASIFGGPPKPEGEKGEDDFAALLDASFEMQRQEVASNLSKARTPEEFQNANQLALEFAATLAQRDALLAQGSALFNLEGAFTDTDDSESAIARVTEFTQSAEALLTPEGQIEQTLSAEDEQFQDLLRRGTELDVLLKEQQLAAAQRQQEFAGITGLLDILPSKQRTDVVAALLETPLGQELFFGGTQGFTGSPNQGGAPLPSAGEVFTESFRGGQ